MFLYLFAKIFNSLQFILSLFFYLWNFSIRPINYYNILSPVGSSALQLPVTNVFFPLYARAPFIVVLTELFIMSLGVSN